MDSKNDKGGPTYLKLVCKDGKRLEPDPPVIGPHELRQMLENGAKITSIMYKGEELLDLGLQ